MSSLKVNSVVDAAGGNTVSINGYTPTMSNMAGRNRIINGDMRIDQRNAGASVTPADGQFTVDRFICRVSQASKFSAQQNAGAVTPPVGFTNYLGATSLSNYALASGDFFGFEQRIEGFNVSDLGWGTANAKAVTLSFCVRSSLTGTFGGSVLNNASNRSYPFTYTITAANTWETKTVTIPGDTSGTWLTNNATGLSLWFGMGMGSTYSGAAGAWASAVYLSATGATSVVGTSGATFYITGVQLEAGSVATPFERRDYGRELMMCQRYYEIGTFKLYLATGGLIASAVQYAVEKRSGASVSFSSSPQGVNYSPSSLEWSDTRGFSGSRNNELNFNFSASAEL